MGYTTRYINPEPLLRKQIQEVDEASFGINAFRQIETRCILNLLKLVTGKTRFNIREITLEETDHNPKRYYLRGEKGYLVFTFKQEE